MRITHRSPNVKLRVIQLTALIFFTVSGGPFGLEPLISNAGKHGSLLILLLIPVFWVLPIAVSVLELNGMMPLVGGYYQWIKRSLGLRWAFYMGWWTWLNAFIDLAIYPKLLVEYAAFIIPSITNLKIIIYLSIVWINAGLNIRGIVPVAKTTIVLGTLLITPFLLLFVATFFHNATPIIIPKLSFKGTDLSSLGLATYIVIWNFMGWDDITTYSNEVEKPANTYLLSVCIAFCVIFSIYFLSTLVAINSNISPSVFGNEGFPALGSMVAGEWLGILISLAGIASALGLFSSILLSISRVPKAIAEDGILPAKFSEPHPKYHTPYVSIIISALFVSCLSLWTFNDLVIVDVLLYGAKLVLEMIALIRMRQKSPHEYRPFKIPLGIPGLIVVASFPLAILFIVILALILSTKMKYTLLWAIFLLFTADLAWRIRSRKRRAQ